MDKIYKTLTKVENILSKCDGYRVEIYSKDKTYATFKEKKEQKETNTNAIGFQI